MLKDMHKKTDINAITWDLGSEFISTINVNTRFAFVSYSKDKKWDTILNMLKDVHIKTDINAITCDLGSEFISTIFTDYCDKNNMTVYFVKNDSHKLGIINRFHRTIKDK